MALDVEMGSAKIVPAGKSVVTWAVWEEKSSYTLLGETGTRLLGTSSCVTLLCPLILFSRNKLIGNEAARRAWTL